MYLANWEAVFLFFDVVTMFLCRSNASVHRRAAHDGTGRRPVQRDVGQPSVLA